MSVTVARSNWLILAVACSLVVVDSTAFGQGTQWTPTRSSSRPERGVVADRVEPATWQNSPAPTRNDSGVRTVQGTIPLEARSRSSSRSSGNTQRLSYNVQLKQGERLVGEPTVVESTPPANSLPPMRPHSEVVPRPDNVSTPSYGHYQQDGDVVHDGLVGQGDIQLDPGFSYEDGVIHEGGGGCTSCNSCNGCDDTSCWSSTRDPWADPIRCPECGTFGYHRPGCGRVAMCLDRCLGPLVREWSVFAGSQGFKGPMDNGQNGNFGFNEGFNLAGPVIPFPRCGLGYQVGARFAQSNLSGSGNNTASRDQAFVTAGLYHRAYRNCGFQWGIAFDWLTDNYVQKFTYSQIRAEASLLHVRGHELGFWGAFGTQSNLVAPLVQASQYNLFYRYTTENGSQGRGWIGITGRNEVILGSDFRVPMSNRFDFVGGFNYIVPNNGPQAVPNGAQQESWGLSMNLVWYVGRPRAGIHNTPFRPLFNVADNNVMMLERP